MKRILCYGDSNTWGYTPGTGVRMDENTRWTCILAQLLGNEYCVVEAGLNARTTSFDDPFRDYLNGRKTLACELVSQKPIDLLIICLGTNDMKFGGAAWSARGLDALLACAVTANEAFPDSSTVFPGKPSILVISPVTLHPDLDTAVPDSAMHGKYEESTRLAECYRPVAEARGAAFLDAAQYAEASSIDGVHMNAENHAKLAQAVYTAVKELL